MNKWMKKLTAALCAAQSVEEPGLYSGADWVSNIYERKNSKAKRGQQIPPFPCGQFFKFMAVNLSFTQFATWAKPLYCV